MRALLVLLVTSCGRVSFDPLADAAPAPTCWPAWLDGTIDFAPPARIEELVHPRQQSNPSVSASGLELYFNRSDPDSDILMTARGSRGEPWGPPRLVAELNTTGDERRATFSVDGLTAILASDRGRPDMDLWLAVRAGTEDTFGAPSPALFAAVNQNGPDELDPELSADGLRLFLSEQRSLTAKRLFVAERSTADDPFGPPALVYPGAPVESFDSDPTVDPDQRVLVFTRESVATLGDLHVALRPDRDAPFGPPRLVPTVNTPAKEGDADLSTDGCELFFGTTRGGREELYVARALEAAAR